MFYKLIFITTMFHVHLHGPWLDWNTKFINIQNYVSIKICFIFRRFFLLSNISFTINSLKGQQLLSYSRMNHMFYKFHFCTPSSFIYPTIGHMSTVYLTLLLLNRITTLNHLIVTFHLNIGGGWTMFIPKANVLEVFLV